MKIVFEAGDGYSVYEKLVSCSSRPDVLLIDISLPKDGDEEFDGVRLTGVITKFFPEIKIVILSVHEDEIFMTQLIEEGAHGYLVKDCDPKEVKEAIMSVYERGSYINERTLRALQNSLKLKKKGKPSGRANDQLTRREIEILQLLCRQMTSDEIADKLFISSKTVNGHRNNLLQKTGSRNTAGLVIYALRNGIFRIH